MLPITDELPAWVECIFGVGAEAVKQADSQVEYNLAGTLYLSSSGYLLLSVPNALLHGVFSAMHEPGIELPPPGPGGQLNAHITVCLPDELTLIGGSNKITERGKQFHYTLGRLYSMEPDGYPDVARVYGLRVHSPELQALRRSYGLSGLPRDGEGSFHVTCAIRRKGVLGRNEVAKV